MPIKEALKELAISYGAPVQDGNAEREEVEKGKQEFMQKLMSMKSSIGQPQMPMQGAAPQEQAPQEQPLPSTQLPGATPQSL